MLIVKGHVCMNTISPIRSYNYQTPKMASPSFRSGKNFFKDVFTSTAKKEKQAFDKALGGYRLLDKRKLFEAYKLAPETTLTLANEKIQTQGKERINMYSAEEILGLIKAKVDDPEIFIKMQTILSSKRGFDEPVGKEEVDIVRKEAESKPYDLIKKLVQSEVRDTIEVLNSYNAYPEGTLELLKSKNIFDVYDIARLAPFCKENKDTIFKLAQLSQYSILSDFDVCDINDDSIIRYSLWPKGLEGMLRMGANTIDAKLLAAHYEKSPEYTELYYTEKKLNSAFGSKDLNYTDAKRFIDNAILNDKYLKTLFPKFTRNGVTYRPDFTVRNVNLAVNFSDSEKKMVEQFLPYVNDRTKFWNLLPSMIHYKKVYPDVSEMDILKKVGLYKEKEA